MSSSDPQVLIVIQEALLAGAISRALTDAGYRVHWATSGHDALEMAGTQPYASFIVELVLSDMLGFHLVHTLRSRGRCAPVLLLGGRSVPDFVAGRADPTLCALPKPFSIDELVGRIRALVSVAPPRREVPPASKTLPSRGTPARLSYHRLEMDPQTRAVTREGRSVTLTDREFAVLDCLMRRPEQVVSKADLSRAVWGAEQEARSNVLEVYMNFLRRKIDQGFDRKLLHTVRGAGYVLRTET